FKNTAPERLHRSAKYIFLSICSVVVLVGRDHYPKARSLLLCADGGGSNSSRTRAWKYHLQQLADELGLPITVCHYPPGTSKWNKIEHRMFSHISMNWAGQPLVSYEAVVNLIGATTTRKGLKIQARLDAKAYATKIKISNQQMKTVSLAPHVTHPKWNYTIIGKNAKT
ncbi:MAG: ISAzo13 family transposase, partial [Phycisphaerae bacterium]